MTPVMIQPHGRLRRGGGSAAEAAVGGLYPLNFRAFRGYDPHTE